MDSLTAYKEILPEFSGVDLQWLLAWKSLTLTDAPLKRTLWTALCACYASNERVMVKNKAGTLRNHNIDAAIARIVDSSEKYPNLTRLTYQSPDIARGQIFHQISAGLSARKHAKSELQSTHDLRVTEACIAFYIEHFKRSPSPATVLGWLFHDLVEDHGVKLEEITSYSNASVAEAVRPVSIPPLDQLKALYPDLGPTDKLAFKHRFKNDMVSTYTMDNVILKFFDGLDAFTSYINEMNHGFIFITNNPAYARPEADPPVFLLKNMLKNLEYRREGNKQLMERCRAISDDAELNPRKIDYAALIPVFESKFNDAAKDFEARLTSSAIIYDKGVSTTPLAHIRAHMRYLKIHLTARRAVATSAVTNGIRATTAKAAQLAQAVSAMVL